MFDFPAVCQICSGHPAGDTFAIKVATFQQYRRLGTESFHILSANTTLLGIAMELQRIVNSDKCPVDFELCNNLNNPILILMTHL